MRILGLDIGEKRVGVAISDPGEHVATPLTVMHSSEAASSGVGRLVDEYEVGRIVVGLPLSLDGSEGPQARRVREFAAGLEARLDVALEYHDERLSSAEARRTMGAAGVDTRKQRGHVDKVAAAIMLQGYLDERLSSEGDRTDG